MNEWVGPQNPDQQRFTGPLDELGSPERPHESLGEADRLRAELNDDPNLTVYQLTPGEQAKIHLRVIACEHTNEYADTIAETTGPVDYYVGEYAMSGTGNESDRAALDFAINGQAVGLPAGEAGTVKMHPTMKAYIASAHYRDAGEDKAILRTMDVTSTDPFPIHEAPHLRRLFDAGSERITEGMAHDAERDLLASLMMGLSRDRLETNRGRIRDFVELTALNYRIREQKQIDDLAVIAANAVRRHPEKAEITIGVMQGGSHSNVLESLTDGTEVSGQLIRVPPDSGDENATPLWQAIHACVRTGELPGDETVDRALFTEYLHLLTAGRYGYQNSRAANKLMNAHQTQVTNKQIGAFLAGADETIAQGRPSDFSWAMNFERQEVPERLLEIPVVRKAIEDIDRRVGRS